MSNKYSVAVCIVELQALDIFSVVFTRTEFHLVVTKGNQSKISNGHST